MAEGWSARVLLGDCVEIMATLEEGSIDAIVCDPPYELGFMGRMWDQSGIAYRPEMWSVAQRLLKPGGHLLAFGGTRTYHRMTVAIEDAGFEIRDSLHWIYGSGFPKSLDVSKAIDAHLGYERPDRVVSDPGGNKVFQPSQTVEDPGAPVSDEAAHWNGWGTALKPAHEPIVLARKLLEANTVAANVLEHGTGALNVKGARIGSRGGTKSGPKNENWSPSGTKERPSIVDIEELDAWRWPSNILISHLPECNGSGASNTDVLCAPGCPVAELNEAGSAAPPNDRGGGRSILLYRQATHSRAHRRDDAQPASNSEAHHSDATPRASRHSPRRSGARSIFGLREHRMRIHDGGLPLHRNRAGPGEPRDSVGSY